MPADLPNAPSPGGDFHSTRWSLVARSAARDPGVAQRALGELCELYWRPLYAFLRRDGAREADALDTLQSFCAQLLERGGLGAAAPELGNFRNYLLGALRHFLANHRRAQRTEKRGAGALACSLDDAEARYLAEPTHDESPERLFERHWALALLERATQRLRADYAARGKVALLAALEPSLLGEMAVARHRDIAAELRTSEGAIKVALHRLRRRMRELILDEVLQTVVAADQVEAELQHLLAALAR